MNTEVTHKFTCNGSRAVHAIGMGEAADIFSARIARRAYGRGGYARTCTQTSYAQDGSLAEFSAFVGYSTGKSETTGHNVNFTVFRA